MNEFVLGVMTGTSIDAIDIALLKINDNKPKKLIDFCSKKFPGKLREDLVSLSTSSITNIHSLSITANNLSLEIAKNINLFLKKQGTKRKIVACGIHGQTITHKPSQGYSIQICNPNLIAESTGFLIVSDFRNRDICRGGQGAPFAPLFHAQIAPKNDVSAFVNIGGIANLSLIANDSVEGYDIGPGNCLIDHWCQSKTNNLYDKNGKWAKSGEVVPQLLESMMNEPFFRDKPPKSTSSQFFNRDWLNNHLNKFGLNSNSVKNEDVQATLTELTANLISKAIPRTVNKVYLCGGGINNKYLVERIRFNSDKDFVSTETLGWDPLTIEASCFGWLAYQTINKKKLDLRQITGAKTQGVLGVITP